MYLFSCWYTAGLFNYYIILIFIFITAYITKTWINTSERKFNSLTTVSTVVKSSFTYHLLSVQLGSLVLPFLRVPQGEKRNIFHTWMALEFWKPSCSSCSSGWTCFCEVRKGCTVATIFSRTGTYTTSRWLVSGWLTHTHLLGNHFSHSNTCSYLKTIFQHVIAIQALIKETMRGHLYYSCSRCVQTTC